MSQVTLTAGAKAVFLDGNYFNRHADRNGDLSLSAGSALRHRLYDMDPAAVWAGDVASDATDDTVNSGLWRPGSRMSHQVDFIAVLGHNLAAFLVDFSDNNGATYPGANRQTVTGETNTYTLRSLSSVINADRVLFTFQDTSPADQYKNVGAIVLSKALLQAPVGMSLFKRLPPRVKAREAKMHDNSTRRTFIGRSDASLAFNDFSVGFSGLTQAQANAMMAVILRQEPIIFVPEPGDRQKNMYLGQAVPNTIVRDYMALSKGGGEFITFDFEESGGA